MIKVLVYALLVHSPCALRALSVHSPRLKSVVPHAYRCPYPYVWIVDFWISTVGLRSNEAPCSIWHVDKINPGIIPLDSVQPAIAV